MDDLASNGPGTSAGWKQTFDALTKYHDQAYHLLDEAITLEEETKPQDALAKYLEGLTVLERALRLPIVCPPNPNLSWERAAVMLQKMKKSKEEVQSRISDLRSTSGGASASLPHDPPSYEEAMGLSGAAKDDSAALASASASTSGAGAASTSGATVAVGAAPPLRTYRELAEALCTLRRAYSAIVKNSNSSNGRNRNQVDDSEGDGEVIFAHDNVRLYFISPDGTVSSSSEPERMQIVQFSENSISENRPPAYLQVGTWIYPLVPGVSPCFRTNYRAFILPDIHSAVEGSAVGLILPEDADESVFELLEIILDGIILQLEPDSLSRSRREVGIAHSVVKGARWVSSRLVSGAERAGDFMTRSTPKLLPHIEKEQPKEFNPKLAKSFEVAKNVSGKAVQVTGFIAGKVGVATSALGRFLAPHIQKQGTRLLTSTFKMDETEAKLKMDNILEVTAGAVEAFGTVYGALDQSAHILAGSLASNTVTLVQHKYGTQAGQVAGNTFDTMGNVFVAGHAIKRLNPKYVAKVAVKETGKAVIEERRQHLREDYDKGSVGSDTSRLEKSD